MTYGDRSRKREKDLQRRTRAERGECLRHGATAQLESTNAQTNESHSVFAVRVFQVYFVAEAKFSIRLFRLQTSALDNSFQTPFCVLLSKQNLAPTTMPSTTTGFGLVSLTDKLSYFSLQHTYLPYLAFYELGSFL